VNLVSTQPPPVEAAEQGRAWISGKGIKTLRRKLGLTQNELAKLTGVSKGAVVQWESKPGMVKFRDKTKKSVMSLRVLGGKAEARKMLDTMVVKKPVRVGKKVGRKAKR
jgi:DNA-binding XRE family transcriptional regulator